MLHFTVLFPLLPSHVSSQRFDSSFVYHFIDAYFKSTYFYNKREFCLFQGRVPDLSPHTFLPKHNGEKLQK